MNGYSDYIRELHVNFFCNYLQGTRLPNPSAGSFFVRLSSNICFGNGAGWTELNPGPIPPSAGYQPVTLPANPFATSAIASTGYLITHLGENDVVFPTALDFWEPIRQVGIWGHPSATTPEYFIAGFEFSTPLNLQAGERLSFRNSGVLGDAKGLRIYHSSGTPTVARGVNTAAETSANLYDTWADVLNSGDSTYPKLRTAGDLLDVSVIKIRLSSDIWVDWMDPDPVGGATPIQDWDYENTLDISNFSLTQYAVPTDDQRWLFRNTKVIVFSPATANRYISTMAVSLNNSSLSKVVPWGGGLVDGDPVTVTTGETPIIEINGFSSTMLKQGQS